MATVDAVLWKRILKSNFFVVIRNTQLLFWIYAGMYFAFVKVYNDYFSQTSFTWLPLDFCSSFVEMIFFLWRQRVPLTSLLQIVAVECPAGTYMTSSGKSCEQCPKGQYQNQSGQVACESCPPGTSTLAVGSSSLSQCLGTMMVTWNFSEQCFIKLMALLPERTGFVFSSHKWSVSCSSNQCVFTCTIAWSSGRHFVLSSKIQLVICNKWLFYQ